MCTYLERNALITVDQSACRERHNTQTALHKVLDEWYYNIADGLLTSVCSFDKSLRNVSIQLTIPFYLRKWKHMDSLVIPLTGSGPTY